MMVVPRSALLAFLALTAVDAFQPLGGRRSNALSSRTHAAPLTTALFETNEQYEQYNEEQYGQEAAATGGEIQSGSHDELMYALGVNLARQLGDIRPLVESGEELAQVAKGLLDTVVGRLNDDGQREILKRRGGELNELIATRATSLKEKLEQAGREMLDKMGETEGVYTLDNNVKLHILDDTNNGGGTRPTMASTVLIHYHGTLADGTVFDSTTGGEPAKFPLAQVIPGWRDGVLNMLEGQTAMLGIPPEQAYGDEGTPDGRIPGGSTLFFKVQLVQVLSAGIGGDPTLVDANGNQLGGDGPGLVGADGRPL